MHIVITEASNGFIISSHNPKDDGGPDPEKFQIASYWDGVMEIVERLDPNYGKLDKRPCPIKDDAYRQPGD